jgi:hypothetical protein
MNLSRYLIQSLDPGAYTLIDRVTHVCYLLMVNSITGVDFNVQLTIVEISPTTDASHRYADAERETFVFRFFSATWGLVECMIRSVLLAIYNYEVDLACPTVLGSLLGGLVNGSPVAPCAVNPSEVH